MNVLVTILLLFVSWSAFANQCSPEQYSRLVQLLESNALGPEQNEHGKLAKFTHHDYPISCDIFLKNRAYQWFTDYKGRQFIVVEQGEKGANYYGLFRATPNK